MAKKYHSARAAKGTVNKGAIAIIVTILVAVLLLGAAVGVMGYGTSGFKDWGFSRFAHKNPAAYEQHEEVPEETGAAIVEPTKGNGMTMLARQATAEEAAFYGIAGVAQENIFTLSVTYEPEDTTFQETDYSIAFKNPGSEWAQGKNVSDYATLTHTEDSKEATVSVLKAFSEQIIVTASNQKHPDIKATTTVDYISDLTSFSLEKETLSSPYDEINLGHLSWSNGTIEPEVSNHVWFVFKISPTVKTAFENKQITVKDTLEYVITNDIYNSGENITTVEDLFQGICNYSQLDTTKQKAFASVIATFAKSSGGDNETAIGYYTYKYERYYNGKTYSSTEPIDDWHDLSCEGLLSYYEVKPTSASSSQSSLVAG